MVLNVSEPASTTARSVCPRATGGESAWRRHLEVGTFPGALVWRPVAQDVDVEGLDSPRTSRSSTCWSSRSTVCMSETFADDLGGDVDRRRWQRRQASSCAAPSRGRRRTGVERPGLALTISSHRGARSDAAPAVHRRWREGAQQKRSRNTFGVAAAIQLLPKVHKGRNIIERLAARPCHLHASAPRRSLRQRPWDQDRRETRPNGCCATWPGVWSMRNRASRARMPWSPGLRRDRSPSSASACRTNSGARSPAPTSIENALAHGARQRHPATSKRLETRRDGAQMDRHPACWRPRNTFRRLKRLSSAAHPPKCFSQEHLRKAQADSAIETIMKAA